ncbi:MAG: hypothetical protein J0J04_08080 [Microbacterium sp.]|uniref:hypothetical protein n=1 Tax=Microbacterium sp. TaxID=51671 RepID=UPI001ACAD263|nr:hypothetical protein [Microbacterium sp.]MBN9214758.1 hypothetical protein [Microbacterium sp.]
MAQPIQEVVVQVKLPIDVYRVLEKKATGAGITAGRLIAEFLIASIRASLTGGPTFVIRKTRAKKPKPEQIVRLGPTGRRGYVRVSDEDLPAIRGMVAAGENPRAIAARFGISVSSAGNWHRRIAAELAEAAAAEPAAA